MHSIHLASKKTHHSCFYYIILFSCAKKIKLKSTHYEKREPRQITFNHSSDIDFKDFRNVKMYCKTMLFLVYDTTLESNNHLHFRNNLLERIQKLIMQIDNKIRDEKLQYNIE